MQNLGLLSFKWLAGIILGASAGAAASSASYSGPVRVELMFVGLCVAALVVALVFRRTSARHPELQLDKPNR